MSFTKEVKEEVLTVKLPKTSDKAFLSALIHTVGSIGMRGGELGFELSCETKSIILRAVRIIKELYGENLLITADDATGPNNRPLYSASVYGEKAKEILEKERIIDLSDGLEVIFGIDEGLFENDYDEKAYVSAAFLGCGSVSLPSDKTSGGYHLEFAFNNGIAADDFASLLLRCGFNPKFVGRAGKSLIYFKDSESILDMLAFIEAMNGVLKMSEKMVERETRNLINRQTNCEMANIDRSLKASERQLSAIRKIDEKMGIDALPDILSEFARKRLENSELSLEELGGLFEPKLTKSGVNYRMRKLMKIAGELE